MKVHTEASVDSIPLVRERLVSRVPRLDSCASLIVAPFGLICDISRFTTFIIIVSQSRKAVQISYEHWLIYCNKDDLKKIFVATGILVFDFGLSIGG